MSDLYWPPGTATGIGSMPGTEFDESVAVVLGELPDLPFLPELPARGLGADMIGRTAALLSGLAVEAGPWGYRATMHAGRVHRRAVDLIQADLDVFSAAGESVRPERVKVQVAGPWTLTAAIELRSGHRVLTDRGARRDFAASLAEGLMAHVADVAERTGARVVVQLDEPTLPAVLAGTLPTPSGYSTVSAMPITEVEDTLSALIEALPGPVIVHCCAADVPVQLLRRAGAHAIALDGTLPTGTAVLDALGECWDAGLPLLLGIVPSADPGSAEPGEPGEQSEPGERGEPEGADSDSDPDPAEPGLRELAQPVLDLADQLGFGRTRLGALAVPTPTCGLAEAPEEWARRALARCRDLGRAFVEPPESWAK